MPSDRMPSSVERSAVDMSTLVLPLTLSGILVFLIAWVLLSPHKAEQVAGWLWSGLSWVGRGAQRRALAFNVQGDINAARHEALKNAPDNIIEGAAKVKFRSVVEAKTILGQGEVVVFMRQREHHAENVAQALMAYLPKAVLPRARRYLDDETMRAADLTLAKAVLTEDARLPGALQCFYDEHLDPAAQASEVLNRKLAELDEIDLHGWLTRVLLAEYRALGEQLFPGSRHPSVLRETERFEQWLHRLAEDREPGEEHSLRFEGKLLRVAVIFVAIPQTLEKKGVAPYRSRAKDLIYRQGFDAVYLMARDHNIPALKKIVASLRSDARVAEANLFEYALRADFAARRLPRERAALACIRRRRSPGEMPVSSRPDSTAASAT